MRKKLAAMLVIVMGCLAVFACSSDPFSDKSLEKAYIKYMTTKGRVAGIPTNPKVNAFAFDNIREIKNFKKIKGYEKSTTEHYVEFSFDMYYKVDASSLIKKYPVEELSKIVGNDASSMVESWKKEDFKAGDQVSKGRSLAMILKKLDSGWEVEEVGLPN